MLQDGRNRPNIRPKQRNRRGQLISLYRPLHTRHMAPGHPGQLDFADQGLRMQHGECTHNIRIKFRILGI
jgi:hypothetical protein